MQTVVFDEFDAIARARGGRGSSQGDAGVARDSLVNQLLTCLDGVDPPVVPTFVIGLTNKRSLIFALFSAEEKGLLGSEHLAKKLKEADLNLLH